MIDDPKLHQLLAEVVNVLEDQPASARFNVSTTLGQVLNSPDPNIVDWAIDYLGRLQTGDAADVDTEEEALQDQELDELEQEAGLPPGRIPLPESADVPRSLSERHERPAYDQNEHDELAWCIECGQVCGHAGHRHGSGDHGEIVCEQCGVTLDKTT
jgi:hypothetical protein